MRKILSLGLMSVLCIGTLAGCAEKTAVQESTVFVEKKEKLSV